VEAYIGSDIEKLTFIMIKPDCNSNFMMHKDLKEQLKFNKLNIIDTFEIELGDEDIKYMWPYYSSCLLTTFFLQCYLVGEKVNVFIVEGENSVTKVKRIKTGIRKKYGLGFFANCMHAPSDIVENRSQITMLLAKAKKVFFMHTNWDNEVKKPKDGLWGRFAELDNERIKVIVDNVWHMGRIRGWDNIYIYKVDNAETYLQLLDDDKNSLDYFTASLYEVFKQWEPEKAIITTLELHRCGSIIISSGDKVNMEGLSQKLLGYGINSRVLCNLEFKKLAE